MQFAGVGRYLVHTLASAGTASLCEGVVGASQVLGLKMEQQFLGSCAESGERV